MNKIKKGAKELDVEMEETLKLNWLLELTENGFLHLQWNS